jgi:tetratricopeptide (TPR) repeat protein
MTESAAANYYRFAAIAPRLKEGEDYELDEKKGNVVPTEKGVEKVEKALGMSNLYDDTNIDLVNHLNQALRAHALFHKDRDYVVRDGQVIILDEVTGRVLEWRRYSEGLHQAIEAKEGLGVREENKAEEAQVLYERALATREKTLGENHLLTAASLNDLGNALYSQGKYEEARPLYERALAIREEQLDEGDPATGTGLSNLGNLLYMQGKYEEARPLYERALAICEKKLQAALQTQSGSTSELDSMSRVAWRDKVDASLALMRCTIRLGEDVDTMSYVEDVLSDVISKYVSDDVYSEEWDLDTLTAEINRFFPTTIDFRALNVEELTSAEILAMFLEDARERLEERKAEWEERAAELERRSLARADDVNSFEDAERRTLLSVVDSRWRQHSQMDYMREGLDVFRETEWRLKKDYVTYIYRIENVTVREEEM